MSSSDIQLTATRRIAKNAGGNALALVYGLMNISFRVEESPHAWISIVGKPRAQHSRKGSMLIVDLVCWPYNGSKWHLLEVTLRTKLKVDDSDKMERYHWFPTKIAGFVEAYGEIKNHFMMKVDDTGRLISVDIADGYLDRYTPHN